MTTATRTRFLVRGTGHWIMVAAVWLLTMAAGMKAADVDAGWVQRLSLTPLSVFFWLLALRAKPGQD